MAALEGSGRGQTVQVTGGQSVAGMRRLRRGRLPRPQGAFWILIALGVPKLVGAVVTLALRRYLGPGVAGRFDLAYAPYKLLDGARSLGIGPALVFEQRLTRPLANTAWTLNMLSALGVTALVQVLVHPLALYYNRPGIESTVRLLSIAYLLLSVSTVHFFLLLRDRDFRARTVPAIGQVLIAGTSAVILAVWGFGVYSLVGRELISAAAGAVILWMIVPFRPRPQLVRRLAARLLRYGVWVAAGMVALYLSQNIDVLIAGRVIRRASDIGFYTTSWDVAFLAAGVVSVLGSSMMFPALSRLQGDMDALRERLLFGLRQLGLLMLPASMFLAAGAPVVIVPLLGAKFGAYRSSFAVLSLLALYAANRTMLSLFFEAYKSVGRPHLLFSYNIARLIVVVPFMLLGAQHGILGLALAYLPLQIVEVPLAIVLARRILGVRPRSVWDALRIPLLASLAMACSIVSVEVLCLVGFGSDDGVALAVAVPVAGATYLGLLHLLDRTVIPQVWDLVVHGL